MTGPHNLVRFAPCFIPGIIGYILLGKWKPKVPWFWWPPFILGAYVAYQWFDPHGLGWVECLALGMAIPFFREVQVPLVRRVAGAIAKYSYGIYLFHLIAMYYCFDRMTGPTWLKIAGSVVFTAAASVASYHLLEEPLIEYGRRVGHALAPPPEKSVAASRGPIPVGLFAPFPSPVNWVRTFAFSSCYASPVAATAAGVFHGNS